MVIATISCVSVYLREVIFFLSNTNRHVETGLGRTAPAV